MIIRYKLGNYILSHYRKSQLDMNHGYNAYKLYGPVLAVTELAQSSLNGCGFALSSIQFTHDIF